MAIFDKLKSILKHPKKYVVTIILGILVIFLGYKALANRGAREKVEYPEILDQVAITVDGQDRDFKECAFYLAYEENVIEKQAQIYNPQDTSKYWNLHIDGEFVRISGREAARELAIHDELFYQLAVEEGLTLTEEEIQSAEMAKEDFWSDLKDLDGDVSLGVTQEDIYETMDRISLAQKYQLMYAFDHGADVSDYDFSGSGYKAILESHKVESNSGVWDRLDFGNIVLNH